jgi:hypothetical protein
LAQRSQELSEIIEMVEDARGESCWALSLLWDGWKYASIQEILLADSNAGVKIGKTNEVRGGSGSSFDDG